MIRVSCGTDTGTMMVFYGYNLIIFSIPKVFFQSGYHSSLPQHNIIQPIVTTILARIMTYCLENCTGGRDPLFKICRFFSVPNITLRVSPYIFLLKDISCTHYWRDEVLGLKYWGQSWMTMWTQSKQFQGHPEILIIRKQWSC